MQVQAPSLMISLAVGNWSQATFANMEKKTKGGKKSNRYPRAPWMSMTDRRKGEGGKEVCVAQNKALQKQTFAPHTTHDQTNPCEKLFFFVQTKKERLSFFFKSEIYYNISR